jgi:hypothetical protein
VLLCGRQGWTQREVADEFNARHPERNPITHRAVGKLVKKFKATGSVVDKPRVGRPSVGEDIRTRVIAKFHAHSHWLQTSRTFCITKACNLPGCVALYYGRWLRMFRRNMLPPSSRYIYEIYLTEHFISCPH